MRKETVESSEHRVRGYSRLRRECTYIKLLLKIAYLF